MLYLKHRHTPLELMVGASVGNLVGTNDTKHNNLGIKKVVDDRGIPEVGKAVTGPDDGADRQLHFIRILEY